VLEHQGKSGDARVTGKSLGAAYVVEGSIRKFGDRIRLSVQLIDTESGKHLWAERMDFPGEDLFAVQDEIVHRIAGTLVGRVAAARIEIARRKPPASLAAYECVLLGNSLPINDAAAGEAKRLFEKAIALDPDYARGYAKLSYALSLEWWADQSSGQELLDKAFDLAKQAVFLDEYDPDNLNALGWTHLARQAYPQAEHYFRKAYELNPQDPWHNGYMGVLNAFIGNADASLAWLAKAKSLDPYFEPTWACHTAGVAHFTAGRHAQAITEMERSMTMPFWVIAYLAAAHALAGHDMEARQSVKKLIAAKPDFTTAAFVRKEALMRPQDRAKLADGLRAAGAP
jgi:adenylate cyclase